MKKFLMLFAVLGFLVGCSPETKPAPKKDAPAAEKKADKPADAPAAPAAPADTKGDKKSSLGSECSRTRGTQVPRELQSMTGEGRLQSGLPLVVCCRFFCRFRPAACGGSNPVASDGANGRLPTLLGHEP